MLSSTPSLDNPLSVAALSFVACLTGIPPPSGINLAAGLYHGTIGGTALFMLGATAACFTSALLVRSLFKSFVLRKMAVWDSKRIALDAAIQKEGAFLIVTLLRLSPVMPVAPANILLALTSVNLAAYTLGSFVGLLPFVFVYAYAGSIGQTVSADGETDSTQLALQLFGVIATILLTVKVGKVAQSALDSAQGGAAAGQQAAARGSRRTARKSASPHRRPPGDVDAAIEAAEARLRADPKTPAGRPKRRAKSELTASPGRSPSKAALNASPSVSPPKKTRESSPPKRKAASRRPTAARR